MNIPPNCISYISCLRTQHKTKQSTRKNNTFKYDKNNTDFFTRYIYNKHGIKTEKKKGET